MAKLRKALLAVLVMVAGITASTLVATPASAQGTAPCPSYYYCFYEHSYYRGWYLNYYSTTSGSFNNPPYSSGDRRNQLSSIINNGNRTICVYNDRWYGDELLIRVAPYVDYPNLADTGDNDKADYWRAYSGSTSCP